MERVAEMPIACMLACLPCELYVLYSCGPSVNLFISVCFVLSHGSTQADPLLSPLIPREVAGSGVPGRANLSQVRALGEKLPASPGIPISSCLPAFLPLPWVQVKNLREKESYI